MHDFSINLFKISLSQKDKILSLAQADHQRWNLVYDLSGGMIRGTSSLTKREIIETMKKLDITTEVMFK